MNAFDHIAEERIQQAFARGEFDDLPGAGLPLELDDDLLVAEELRVAYRVLKNAGFTPPEVALRAEIGELEMRLSALPEDEAYRRALAKLALLRLKLSAAGQGRGIRPEAKYFRKVVARLGARLG
jgi:Domain of unknown function (DUF1992)